MALAERPETQFDQLMVLHDPKTPGTAAFVRIFNTDGSEAGACGNGTRCVADYLSEAFRDNELKLETQPGVLTVWKAGPERYTVDMGRPKFGWQDIPLVEEFRDTRAVELQVGPIDAPIIHSPSVVNVGNPHCIFWVDSLDIIDLGKVGPMLEFHRLFPERANISLAHVTSRTSIDLKVWERGVGLTEACGSAACAAAVCAVRKKFTERKVTVNLPGGPLGNRMARRRPHADDRPDRTGEPRPAAGGDVQGGVKGTLLGIGLRGGQWLIERKEHPRRQLHVAARNGRISGLSAGSPRRALAVRRSQLGGIARRRAAGLSQPSGTAGASISDHAICPCRRIVFRSLGNFGGGQMARHDLPSDPDIELCE